MQAREIHPKPIKIIRETRYGSTASSILLAALVSLASGAEGQRRLISLSGQDPDGDGPYAFYDSFGGATSATINDLSDVAFVARVYPNDGFWEQSIWRVRNDVPWLVTVGGSIAPGTSSAIFNGVVEGFYAPSMNDNGEVAFRDTLEIGIGSTDPDNDEGIWSTAVSTNGSLGIIVREGDIAPGTNGARFGGGVRNTFSRPALSNSGAVVFSASLKRESGVDETNDTGIWAYISGQFILVARAGDPAPGVPNGTFRPFFNPTFAPSVPPVVGQNAAGDVVFHAKAQSISTLDGIWRTTNGKLELVALDGQPVPQTSGEVWNIFGTNVNNPLVMNDSGSIPFIAASGSEDGVWIASNSGIELTVQEGDIVPGSSQAFFTQFGNSLDTNDSEDVAFPAWIDPGDGSSELDHQIWAYLNNELVRVAAAGDVVRGTGGYVIRSLGGTPTLNDRGDIVFEGVVTRPDTTWDSALLSYSSVLEEVVLIAELGEEIDVSTGQDESDLRVVVGLSFDDEIHTANNSPEPRDGSTGLNNLGEIAYVVSFDGSYAVFVTTLRSCKADLDGDHDVDFFDVSIYLNQYLSSDPAADIDGIPGLNFFDVSQFLSEYLVGCPGG